MLAVAPSVDLKLSSGKRGNMSEGREMDKHVRKQAGRHTHARTQAHSTPEPTTGVIYWSLLDSCMSGCLGWNSYTGENSASRFSNAIFKYWLTWRRFSNEYGSWSLTIRVYSFMRGYTTPVIRYTDPSKGYSWQSMLTDVVVEREAGMEEGRSRDLTASKVCSKTPENLTFTRLCT